MYRLVDVKRYISSYWNYNVGNMDKDVMIIELVCFIAGDNDHQEVSTLLSCVSFSTK